MKKTKSEKQLDKDIERAWYRLASGVQVNIMNIGKVFADARAAMLTGATLDDAVTAAREKYREN